MTASQDTRDPGLRYRQSYDRYQAEVHIRGAVRRVHETAAVLPEQTVEVSFFGRGMPLRLDLSATRAIAGSPDRLARMRLPDLGVFDPLNPVVVDPGTPSGPSSYQAAITIALYPPTGGPAYEWSLPEGNIDGASRRIEFPEGRPQPQLLGMVGFWRLAVTPTSAFAVHMSIEGEGPLGTVPVRTKDVSARLLNRVFAQALDAVALGAKLQDGAMQVWISEEIAGLMGVARTVLSYPMPSAVSSAPALEQLKVELVPGQTCIDRLNERITRVSAQLAAALAAGDHGAAAKWSEARAALESKRGRVLARASEVCIRIQAFFTDAPITSYFDIDVAEIDGDLGEMFLLFSKDLTSLTPIVLLSIEYGTLANLADLVGLASLPRKVDEQLEAVFYIHQAAIASYFRAALGRLVARDGVALRCEWAAGARIEYYVDLPRPTRENTPVSHPAGSGGTTVEDLGALAPVAPDPRGADGSGPGDPLGVFPSEFEVVAGPALSRLDQTQSLVVIMMENRSFDHLLGDLPRARPRVGDRYDGLPDAGATTAPAVGFAGRIPMVRASELGLDTQIPVSPNHHHGPVMFQIGGGTPETAGSGAMDGFALDLAHRTDGAQMAMSYYGEAELPIYYRLADEQLVCDRWFCAHPGPTWPNRWVTVCGVTPELENPENDDPRLGYMTEATIFDTLTQYGVEWKIFESDLSLIRLFDKYRVDDTNVLPLSDLDATLRRSGPLPRVMFIEPNFIDVPGGVPNDDHPPADLADGQRFIATILDKFRDSGRWNQVAIVITYDEHGGFYDHVPPPGTAQGDPAWLGRVPPVHPEGPAFLGVRVPTFVISPFVAGPGISHVVFDHTSIIKTVLVHNRARLPRSVFGRFGARVNQAAHVGQALSLDSPRPAPQRSFQSSLARTAPASPSSPAAPPAAPARPGRVGGEHGSPVASPPAEPLRPFPGRPRAPSGPIAPLQPPREPAPTPPLAPPAAPHPAIQPRARPRLPSTASERDFHAGLRGLFKPRRRYPG